MSEVINITAWIMQVRLLTLSMDAFQEQPTAERQAALLEQIHAYAEAARRGTMEIPVMGHYKKTQR
jgi:hypothetical protein